METLEDFFDVVTKNGFLLILWLSIVLIIVPLIGFGAWELGSAMVEYIRGDLNDTNILLVKLLHALEFFFISPIPTLILFSFRHYVLSIFPILNNNQNENNDEESLKQTEGKPRIKSHARITQKIKKINEISPEMAERAFISSLIGITSTFFLGKLIDAFKCPDEFSVNGFYLFSLLIIFLAVQIFFYRVLSKEIENVK